MGKYKKFSVEFPNNMCLSQQFLNGKNNMYSSSLRVLEHEGVGCIGERKGRGEAGRRMEGGDD